MNLILISIKKAKVVLFLSISKLFPGYSVSWSCRIHWLHLWRGIRSLPQMSVLGMIIIWWWGSNLGALRNINTPPLPLLQGPLWPKVVVHVRVPSIGQIYLFNHLLYLKPFSCVQTNDQNWIELLVLDHKTWNFRTVCKWRNNVE